MPSEAGTGPEASRCRTNPRLPIHPGPQNDIALYGHAPLAATLERLVDFDLLNRGATRLSVRFVAIETGDEVVFDTKQDRIGPQHILASATITPGFPPVKIGGRMLCDPSYTNNSPVNVPAMPAGPVR